MPLSPLKAGTKGRGLRPAVPPTWVAAFATGADACVSEIALVCCVSAAAGWGASIAASSGAEASSSAAGTQAESSSDGAGAGAPSSEGESSSVRAAEGAAVSGANESDASAGAGAAAAAGSASELAAEGVSSCGSSGATAWPSRGEPASASSTPLGTSSASALLSASSEPCTLPDPSTDSPSPALAAAKGKFDGIGASSSAAPGTTDPSEYLLDEGFSVPMEATLRSIEAIYQDGPVRNRLLVGGVHATAITAVPAPAPVPVFQCLSSYNLYLASYSLDRGDQPHRQYCTYLHTYIVAAGPRSPVSAVTVTSCNMPLERVKQLSRDTRQSRLERDGLYTQITVPSQSELARGGVLYNSVISLRVVNSLPTSGYTVCGSFATMDCRLVVWSVADGLMMGAYRTVCVRGASHHDAVGVHVGVGHGTAARALPGVINEALRLHACLDLGRNTPLLPLPGTACDGRSG